MQVLPNRALAWVFIIAVLVIGSAAFTNDAAAQVFQGPLDFQTLPPVTMTVTLHPAGPATYQIAFSGRTIDTGTLTASVSGSFVAGFFQSNDPTVRACFFQGNLNGNTANLVLEPGSCGAPGTLTLTRIS